MYTVCIFVLSFCSLQ
uniref:Uncharacterized protein n=1 Tax=Anguilla anguilla TaxID=7936 RepID=A0A0E9VJA2_ANGAN